MGGFFDYPRSTNVNENNRATQNTMIIGTAPFMALKGAPADLVNTQDALRPQSTSQFNNFVVNKPFSFPHTGHVMCPPPPYKNVGTHKYSSSITECLVYSTLLQIIKYYFILIKMDPLTLITMAGLVYAGKCLNKKEKMAPFFSCRFTRRIPNGRNLYKSCRWF